MPETEKKINIPLLLPPHGTNFFPWFERVVDVAHHLGSHIRTHGVAGHCYSAIEWTNTFPNRAAFEDVVQPLAFDAAAFQAKDVQFQYTLWKERNDEWKEWHKACESFRDHLVAALDDTGLHAIKDDDGSIVNLSVADIIKRLKTAFYTPTSNEVTDAYDVLRKPFSPGGSMLDHVRSHVNVHRFFHRHGVELGGHEKYRFLVASLSNIPSFTTHTVIYTTEFPTPAKQSFETYAKAMIAAANNQASVSAGAQGYALSATTAPRVDYDARLQRIEEALKTLAAGRTRRNNNNTGALAPKDRSHYCWTHGTGGHASAQCKHPAAGHQVTATGSNKMGGKA